METENSATATEPTISTQLGTSDEGDEGGGQSTEPATEIYKPFATGKEKFKVDDKEEEWDWNTTKKYAQLGKSSTQRMQQAAQIQKQAKETYAKLISAAAKDPEGLIRMLNPQFRGFANTPADPQATQSQGAGAAPARDPEREEDKAKIQSLEEKFEAMEVEAERKKMESELDAAVKDYPQLGNKFLRSYVKAQYLQALKSDLTDLTLQDIAFQVAQEWDGLRAEELKAKKQKFEETKRKAPVGSVPGSGGEKPMTREDILRLAGRVV